MQNFYKGNAAMLGEWATASRVQWPAKRNKQTPAAMPARVASESMVKAEALPEFVQALGTSASTSTNGNGAHGNGIRVAV